jgi:alginate O-acetyltransferase complex protein AlgI
MVFSSLLFLFLFLPVALALHALVPGLRLRNLFLLLASLVFYAWGEVQFVLLLLLSTLINYALGLWVEHATTPAGRRWIVACAVFFNIGTLAYFKYANFLLDGLNTLLSFSAIPPLTMDPVRLPIGISFFTFHALSYIIDVYRGNWRSARNPTDLALYIFFFPQLIAGPIMRWSAIAPQLAQRAVTSAQFAEGVRRFVEGLAKKMIIANAVAVPADQIFALPADQISAPLAWFGTLCYTLQIYFDFSGYSDMAMGLGLMFGFKFMENFNFPYISQSIRDFWRRWHISLSTWFRNYLYIPLGGNRVSAPRHYLNLVTVFFLCGLWHGASWTFVIWGLYHGFFLVLEQTPFGRLMERIPRPARHAYALLVVMIGWVLFRADSLPQAGNLLAAMFGLVENPNAQPLSRFASNQVLFAVTAGIVLATPVWPWLRGRLALALSGASEPVRPYLVVTGGVFQIALTVFLFIVSAAWLAAGTYNPFIYFRF